ncbi:MAG: dihydrolipoyl dehydrogenase [candidate division WOR-3 bacterium]
MNAPDILIIGAGPGGYVAAIRAAQLGKKILLVDKDLLGGVCLNRGCIPTKTWLHYTKILFKAKKINKVGIKFNEPEINLDLFNDYVENVVNRLRKGIEYLLKTNGVEYLKAKANFVDRSSVAIATNNGQQIVKPRFIIIATGSKPLFIPDVNIDNINVFHAEQAFIIKEIPKSIIIIGAGAIGVEFATIYHRLGSDVKVIEITDQILPNTDKEIAQHLMKILQKQGINFYLNSKVNKIIKKEQLEVHLQSVIDNPHNQEKILLADKVLIAIGRSPNIDGLNLENTEIELNEKQIIKVNLNCQTTQKNIYAIGDVIGPPLLAHKAMMQGIFVAEKICGLNDSISQVVPNCIYTDPELATVGLSEEQTKDGGYDFIIGKAPLSAIGRAHCDGEIDGLVKIIVDNKNKRLLGAHILAPDASNLIGELNLAMNCNLSIEHIINTIHPHPTLSEAILEACASVEKKAIHIINS